MTFTASFAAFGFPPQREELAIWAMAIWRGQVAYALVDGELASHLREARAICADDWWDANLSGIAWGSDVGKLPSEQETRLDDLRAQGYGWLLACREIYPDQKTAAMIALHMELWEAGYERRGYGHEKTSWPPVSLN